MKGLHLISFILLIIGGLNWLVIGLFGQGLGDWIDAPGLMKVIYILVGLAALYELFTHKKNCRQCKSGGTAPQMGA